MAEENTKQRVLLTGATGFVGLHLYPKLIAAKYDVVCATRHPERAAQRYPSRQWVHLDADDPATLEPAMEGCTQAVYLIHGMAAAGDYEKREQREAQNFVDAAERSGLKRMVYLGGMRPIGTPSRHLRSRLRTGEILRSGKVPTIELQASMLIGSGSASWRIVRDLSMRLPIMVLPNWLKSRSQPIAAKDAVVAICAALALPADITGAFALPGPETLTAKEILRRVAELRGSRPIMIDIPIVSPTLSSYWIQWVTRGDAALSRELVQGLKSDLVAPDTGFWRYLPDHRLMPFDEAARQGLHAEEEGLSRRARVTEKALHRLGRRQPPDQHP